MAKLVVVESPTKARTIRKFLPAGEYRVEASMGHIRDLPASAAQIPAALAGAAWARLGVNVEGDFEPLYIIPPEKEKVVRELRAAAKEADEVYIATDEDREGESIGWHLLEVLRPRVPVRRMVFHEITREAILGALTKTRQINTNLVDAQETRRVLDRLYGYTISPLLWKKIARGLSAGRVQSVAVRLLVLREKERMAFVSAGYWDLKAQLAHQGRAFEAQMTHLEGVRLASGKDFDAATGRLKEGLVEGKDVVLLDKVRAHALAELLPAEPWTVSRVEERAATRAPAAPFITSTLQQEGSRKLGLSARDTMRVAQSLYENGHITYMRTDSTSLSNEAVTAARAAIAERYGERYLSPAVRRYATRVANAQEAHEAIRPAGSAMRTADEIGLSGVEARLYDLIWKRTVASQMADARLRMVTATLEAGEAATFRASGKTIEFPGFFRVYVEGSDDPEAALEDREQPLPPLARGDRPECRRLEAVGHETKPPARYTEATLIKTLESEGIGRPSTYASIIDTITHRGYAARNGGQLAPSFTAFATNNLLESQFERLVDLRFTAAMEKVLDDIAAGQKQARPYLKDFYQGEEGLVRLVDDALDEVDARTVSTIQSPKWGDYVVRVGKYGPYVEGEVEGELRKASLPEGLPPADVTEEDLRRCLVEHRAADEPLGADPETGLPVLLKKGPYGPYVQLGADEDTKAPRRTSLPKHLDPADLDLDMALGLLALPRPLGLHPEHAKEIKAGIGRFGPYVQMGTLYASLGKDDDVLAVALPRAIELIDKKMGRSKALRDLGAHPETGREVQILDGRFGPYVKHGKTNATLPKERPVEAVTLEEALALLRAKEGAAKPGRTRKPAAAPKKAAPKKAAAPTKASAAKKPAAPKKAAAKKAPAKAAAPKKPSTPAKTAPSKSAAPPKKAPPRPRDPSDPF